MRIVLAHSHANTFGGGERAVLGLGRGLARRGHDVRLVLGGFSPANTYAELAEFPIRRLGRAGWLAADVAADAIVANSFGANLLALRHGGRVAYWVHSLRSVFLQPGRRRPDLLTRRAADWVAARRAGALVANSYFTAGRVRRLYGRDAGVVYPGVDVDVFAPGESAGEFAITVGRLSVEKGLRRLLALWRDVPDLPLVVVGGGAPEVVRELQAHAPSGVRFVGPLAPNGVAAMYQQAAVAVFAPHDEEFGIAPLEAMASGVPVVAWRGGGLVETIVDGQTGFLADDEVTFRQRVRLLCRDQALRRQMGVAARARAEHFSWGRAAEAMERVCQQLTRQPGAGPSESLSQPHPS
jgi:glycosyltransferase involved in cell wall biosynthesis